MTDSRVAIIGGGPGGLMTADRLGKLLRKSCEIYLFEASGRLGGKVRTETFSKSPIRYEAGAAELYDYSGAGADPLREMVREFDLTTRPMAGPAVVLDGHVIRSNDDLARHFGPAAADAIRVFDRFAKSAVTPQDYYESDWKADNRDPLNSQTFAELLATITDPVAREYVRIVTHSDIATEAESTSAMYGLQNYLMNEPGYMRLYSIDGGIEQLMTGLIKRSPATLCLHHRVTAVEKNADGTYAVDVESPAGPTRANFDFVVAALPNAWLTGVRWGSESLQRAMAAHVDHYDHPAHYLRVTVLFESPFWRPAFGDSYFMLDAFGGCCVYDESSRIDGITHGVLGWLIAGASAVAMAGLPDGSLIDAVLGSLPADLRHGRGQMIEARVHRWIGSVNGLPGGFPVREPDSRHRPDPENHPAFFVVGDYLFDSTLNGVLDSADTVAEWIAEELEELQA